MVRRSVAGGLVLLVGAVFPAGVAHAVVVRHDVAQPDGPDYDYETDPYVIRAGNYPAVATVFAGGALGTGVLVANEWVLTAAHVADEALEGGGFVAFGEFGISQVDYYYRHDNYIPYDDENGATTGPAGGFDLALMHLLEPPSNNPEDSDYIRPVQRYRGPTSGLIGRVGTSVGNGLTGDGRIGFDDPANPDPDEASNHLDGAMRAGDNRIDSTANVPAFHGPYLNAAQGSQFFDRPEIGLTKEQIAGQYLVSDFDDPASGEALPFEMSVAPGDSGGPVFIDGGDPLSTEDDLLVGVHSFVFGPPAPHGDGYDNASYGDLYGSLDVSQFNAWIDPLIGVPEPGGAAAVLFAGAAMLRRRRSPRQ